MTFLEKYTDPRALEYPFLGSPIPAFTYLAAYLIFVIYLGPKLMQHRKPFGLKYITAAYNIAQIAMCVLLIDKMREGGFTTEYLYKCHSADYSRSPSALTMLQGVYYTFLLKGLELWETVIFVLRKKQSQVSFLHVYHHVGTFTLIWFYARSIGGDMLTFSIVINSVVHMFMYFYYFLSVFGPTVQRKLIWFKKSITIIQMVQFVFILANNVIAFVSCNCSKTFIAFYGSNILYLLYLFGRFYQTRYDAADVAAAKKVASNAKDANAVTSNGCNDARLKSH